MDEVQKTYIEDQWFKRILNKASNCRNLREFVYKVFNRKLEKNQYWALRDMLDPAIRLIYYSSARQSGKTEVIALFQAIAAMFPHCVIPHYEGKGNCYVFAPKQEQAQISFERFSNFIHFNNYNLYSNELEVDKADRIRFNNGFEVRAITASRNAEIEGLTTHIIILDESQAISPYKVRESILPMGGGIKGGAKIIQCGVPGILGSHFHKAYKNKYDNELNPFGYRIHEYPWNNCPRLDKNYVMSIKGDEEAFARNYELNWAKNNFGYFITTEQYEACELSYNPAELTKKAIDEGWQFHWGLDFAKYKDSTVLTVLVQNPETGHFYIVGLVELQGVDYMSQIGYLKNAYVPGRVVHICADKTAVGDPLVEQMNESGMRTTGIVFNQQSKDKIYKNFRHWISSVEVHWPKAAPSFSKELKRFKQQMIELELEYKPTGLISVHHNLDDNQARDDYPDSACLGVWSGAEYIEPRIDFVG